MQSSAGPQLPGIEGELGLVRLVPHLLARSHCCLAPPSQLTPPLEHRSHLFDGFHPIHSLPISELALHHGQEGDHKLPLPHSPLPERHVAGVREDILADPCANSLAFHENHPYCRSEITKETGQRCKAFENFEELIVRVAHSAQIDPPEEAPTESRSLKQKPPLTIVYDFNNGHIRCRDMPPRRKRLCQPFGRGE